jgi:hypothetical protein
MRNTAQWGEAQWGEEQWGQIVAPGTITPATGTLTLTGIAPQLNNVVLTPATGTLVLTGVAPQIAVSVSITPGAGALVLTGIAPQSSVPVTATPGSGSLVLTGIAPRAVINVVAPDGIGSAEAFGFLELIGAPGATGTIEPSSITTLEAFGSATLIEDATLYPTGIPSAFDMDLHTVGAPVATIQPQGIPSEEAFGGDGLGALSGPSVVTIVTPGAPLPGTGSALNKKLCSPVGLSRADLFPDAPDPAFILPDVYGDFSEGGIRGPCPAVLVTALFNFVYVAAAHPVQEISHVYVDDVEIFSGFATRVSVEVTTGLFWALIIMTEQATGPVSWRGKGRMDETGALIENPVDQLHTFLTHRCGYMTDDFDAATLSEARAAATSAGWTTAWVFQDDRQTQDWITEIMFNVMGIWRVSGRGQLQLILDVGGTPRQIDIVASVVAAKDCLDGDDGVTWVSDRDHLVNQLQAYYLFGWALGQASSRLIDLEDATSVNAYGELRKSVTLRGHRVADQVRAWAQILFERQSFAHRVEGAMVSFRVSASALAHVTTGDLIAFTWPYGPRRELGNPYVNQILRVLTISHEFAQGGVTSITAVDTGTFVNIADVRVLEPLAL